MAYKSNLNVTVVNSDGVSIEVLDDSSGYLQLQMSDGKNTVIGKFPAPDFHVIRSAFSYADLIRSALPQS